MDVETRIVHPKKKKRRITDEIQLPSGGQGPHVPLPPKPGQRPWDLGKEAIRVWPGLLRMAGQIPGDASSSVPSCISAARCVCVL